MGTQSQEDVTQILQSARSGRRSAIDALLPIVYDELHRMARNYLRQERSNHTLGATGLLHEVYLRLIDQERAEWQSRAHFMAIAAQAARRILLDHARTRQREKRQAVGMQVPISAVTDPASPDDIDLLALHEALERLALVQPDAARIVEMRYFGGMSMLEIAEVLGVADRTVRRRWQYAKAWLYREVSKGDTRVSSGQAS